MDMLNGSRALQNPTYGGSGKPQPLYDEISNPPTQSKFKGPGQHQSRSPYADPVVRQNVHVCIVVLADVLLLDRKRDAHLTGRFDTMNEVPFC